MSIVLGFAFHSNNTLTISIFYSSIAIYIGVLSFSSKAYILAPNYRINWANLTLDGVTIQMACKGVNLLQFSSKGLTS